MITGKTIALTAAAAKSLQSCPTLSDPIDTAAHQAPPPRPWDSPGKNTGVGCHFLLQCVKVKSESEVTQLHLTLSNPMDCSLPGSSIHGIFQARVLEWVAIAFSDPLCYLISKRLICLSGYLGSSTRVQKLFCGSCSTCRRSSDVFAGEKVVTPSYFSTILGPLF